MKLFSLLPVVTALISLGAYAQGQDYLSDVMLDYERKIEEQLYELKLLTRNNSNVIIDNGVSYLVLNNIKYEILENGNIKIPYRTLSDESAIRNLFPFFDNDWELTWYNGGAVFVNKNFGNYNYGNGCLLEYYPNYMENDNFVVKESATCKYKNNNKTLSFKNENDININVNMSLTKVKSILALVSDIE